MSPAAQDAYFEFCWEASLLICAGAIIGGVTHYGIARGAALGIAALMIYNAFK